MKNADLSPVSHAIGSKKWRWLLGIGLPLTTGLLILTQVDLESGIERLGDRLFPPPEIAHPYPFQELLQRDRTSTTGIERQITHYQQQIRKHPDSGLDQAALAVAYLRMARATGQASWYLLADRAAQQSLARLPFNNSEALLVLARVAEARHDFATVLRLVEQIPAEREAIALQVTTNLATGNLVAAHQSANQLVDQSLSLSAFTLLALVQIAQGRDQEALNSFQYALETEEPGELSASARLRTLMGRFYYERGQLDRADALYREALRILPDYPPALLNRAQLALHRGNYSQASRLYQQVADLASGNTTIYTPLILRGQARLESLRGNSSAAEQRWNEAEVLLRQGSTGTSNFTFGHQRDLARVLLERGRSQDLSTAIALLQTELERRRDANTLETYSEVLSAADRWQEARNAIQEAIGLGTREASVFDQAGQIEQALGNFTLSRTYFRIAREINPQFDATRKAAHLGVGI